MSDIRVFELVISKSKVLSVSPARKLRSVSGFPHIPLGDVPCPHGALPTVVASKTIGTFSNVTGVYPITDSGMPASENKNLSSLEDIGIEEN
jgi:hypothetical protein